MGANFARNETVQRDWYACYHGELHRIDTINTWWPQHEDNHYEGIHLCEDLPNRTR